MAQQQIITKPYVEEIQDNDSLFINHDGALRQIKKGNADFASGADMRAEVAAREAFETSVREQIAEKANVDGYYEEMTVGDAEQLVATQFVEDNEPYLFRSTGGSFDVGNRAYLDKIVGGTVAWNQMFNKASSVTTGSPSIASISKDSTTGVITWTTSDTIQSTSWYQNSSHAFQYHKVFCSQKVLADKACMYSIRAESADPSYVDIPANTPTLVAVIKSVPNYNGTAALGGYIANCEANTVVTISDVQFIDLTQMFGSTIADYVYSLEQATAGAGVAWFKKLFPKDYYAYNAGELLSVEGLQSHDAVGFNQWDEEWVNGTYGNHGELVSTPRYICSKNKTKVLPSTTYYIKAPVNMEILGYGADKEYIKRITNSLREGTFTTTSNMHYITFGSNTLDQITTYNHDICINLSNPTRNGEYEPYEKHSYPLDSSLTLRGIPKLDASNNLYYDGDEYTSDGKVKRKYGIVDLGSLNWTYDTPEGAQPTFVAQYLPIKKASSNNVKVESVNAKGYISTSVSNMAYGSKPDKAIGISIYNQVIISDSSYTDAATFKAAMSGVMLVYELATPTTETAEPYQFTQIIDDFGTEEFVSNGFIPAGHMTRYPANLRDKLQHLPDLASMDGTYLIQQSDKQMSLVYMPAVFPETPTEDGTYTLKTVVTGGVATLQWVAE